MSAIFLSVTNSALGRRWLDRLDEAGQREAMAMAQSFGLRDTLARVLAGRGVTVQTADSYLEPTLKALMPDPSTLRDMDSAVARIAIAIQRRENVAIFGDYDVDGATSAALLADYLRHFGVPVTIHIPDRITEGYGPNTPAIRTLRGDGASLLVTVDCGVASFEPLAEARRIGFDVVVLDHHLAGETLPDAVAIVNPNRQDDVSGLGTLAACGVTLMTLAALNRRLREQGQANLPDLMLALDLVALGTVADVVPLTGLNRAFVRQGLRIMRQRGRPGLAALMDAAGLKEAPEAYHLGFLVGPRINAGGRIGDAALGARLLTTADALEAGQIASELDRLNRERQTLEQLMLVQAEETVAEQEALKERAVIVAGSADWHPGIVGLVASRLKERYRRPAIAIAWDADKGQGTASARSVAGVDLGRAVRAAVEAGLIIKGGGHAMAAGLTLTEAQLEPLRAFLEHRLAKDVSAAQENDSWKVDAAISAGGLTLELAEDLARASPFGQGNAEPLLALADHELTDVMPVGAAHMRVRFRSADGAVGQGVAFRAQGQPMGDALLARRGKRVHLLGNLAVDRWGGRVRVDLRIVDLADAR